jgi:hypothetical protein
MSETQLLACPCCGFKTITSEFDICDICGWEHNFYQEENPDDEGGPNSVSFREAQQNFVRFGAKSEASLRHSRKPTLEDERDPNWKPIV